MLTKTSIKNECDVVGLSESVRLKAETLAHRLMCLLCIFEQNSAVCAVLKNSSKKFLDDFGEVSLIFAVEE